MTNFEAKPFRYKMKIWKPTPEQQERLDRRHKEMWEYARRKLREREGA